MWVSKEKIESLQQKVNDLNSTIKDLQSRSILLDITTKDRKLVFTFVRGDQVHQIETMRLMTDNLRKWREDLLR